MRKITFEDDFTRPGLSSDGYGLGVWINEWSDRWFGERIDERRGSPSTENSRPQHMPDTSVRPLRLALEKLWVPVPWMLETAILLELALGKYVEAAIIAGLLVFNAVLGLFQESRAQATLAALKSRLALNPSVRRDGAWKTVLAAELVLGDLVKLSLGGVVAADVKLTAGNVLLDQSMLTGESVPIEAGPGVQTFAGALVRRGEAVAEVNRHRALVINATMASIQEEVRATVILHFPQGRLIDP